MPTKPLTEQELLAGFRALKQPDNGDVSFHCEVCEQHVYDYFLTERRTLLEYIREWAEGTTGATGVDIRGRKWIDLGDLDRLLDSLTNRN